MADNLTMKDTAGKDWSITELPAGLMDEFSQVAAEMYPGETNPWMHFILDTIGSVCNMDRAVFQMTDIPLPAIEGLEKMAQQCDYTRFSLFSVMLQAAAKDNFVLGRMHTDESGPGDSVCAVMTGIPSKVWNELEVIAREQMDAKLFGGNKPTAMGVLMLIFEFAKLGGFKIDARLDTTESKPAADVKSNEKPKPARRRSGTFDGN